MVTKRPRTWNWDSFVADAKDKEVAGIYHRSYEEATGLLYSPFGLRRMG